MQSDMLMKSSYGLQCLMLNIEHKIHASWSKLTMFPLSRLYPLESYCNFWPRSLKSMFVRRVFMLINLSLVVRKPAFCIRENKDVDQLRSNYCAADQRRWFRYTDSTIPLLPIYEIFKLNSSHLLWLYSLVCVGLVGNPKDRFSHNEAHFVILLLTFLFYSMFYSLSNKY